MASSQRPFPLHRDIESCKPLTDRIDDKGQDAPHKYWKHQPENFSEKVAGEVGLDGLGDSPTGRVFGGPSQEAIFTPYQGDWKLEGRTFDPPLDGATISGGPDIAIKGHIIRFGSGMLVRELRLCQTRKTDDGIECEAWHHEDIHDPGDMQRADCKLRIIEDKLELRWRIADSGDFSDDPIIASPDYVPPDRQGSADTLSWWVETYSRKPAK